MTIRKPPRSKIRSISQPDLQPGDLVWVYLRHSPGEDQDIRSQREAVDQYCQQRGLLVMHWWIDEARSGGSVEDRRQFEAMMAASRQQPPAVKAIIVWDLSRFSRDDLEAQFYSADLRLRGYQIVSVKDDIPQGEFAGIFESFIRWKNWRYLVDLQANVMRGLDSTVYSEMMVDGQLRRGFSGGGFPPVGYEARQVQVGVKPSGKPQLLTYWIQSADGDLRARVQLAWQMALEAAREGHKPPVRQIHQRCRLHRWLSSYYELFRSLTYVGIRKVGERRVQGAHEGYVSQEEYDMLQPHLPDGKLSPRDAHPKRVNSAFLLSGKTLCGYCGARIDLERENRRATFATLRCSTRKRDSGACTLMKLSLSIFMDGILEVLRGEVLTEERFHEAIEELNRRLAGSKRDAAEQRRQLVREISGLTKSVERLLDAIESGQATPSVRERLLQREREKALKESQLSQLALEERHSKPIKVSAAAIRRSVEAWRGELDTGDEASLKALLDTFIVRVEITNETGRVDYTLPADVVLSEKGGYEGHARRDSNHSHLCGSGQFAILRRHSAPKGDHIADASKMVEPRW